MGIAQTDLHSESFLAQAPSFSFATTSTTYYYRHITEANSSFTSGALATLTLQGRENPDPAFKTFFVHLPSIFALFPSKTIYIYSIYFSIPTAEWASQSTQIYLLHLHLFS